MADLVIRILENYGIPLALVVFFIWRDWKREQQMTSRIQGLEGEMRDILKTLVKDTTKALVDNTHAIKELLKAMMLIPCIPCEYKKTLEKSIKEKVD